MREVRESKEKDKVIINISSILTIRKVIAAKVEATKSCFIEKQLCCG